MEQDINKIELRSQEVQDILSRPPKKILRYGTTVICLIVAILLFGSMFFEYPDKILGDAEIQKIDSLQTYLAYVELKSDGVGKIRSGQQVVIKLSAYPYLEYGYLLGKTLEIEPKEASNKYIVKVEINSQLITSARIEIKYDKNLAGTAEIITENMTFFDRVFNPLKNIIK
ncbi:hypothetical protein MASR2M117_21740 [Paludibacter sp.]